MNSTVRLTDTNFDYEVLCSERPVLVDFWAPWCGPCRVLGPMIEDLAAQHGGRIAVGKLNVDENPEAARGFGIRSIPTVLVFKDGHVVERLVGAQPIQRYQEALQRAAT